METRTALIGFGEAGRTFAEAGGWSRRARAYDVKTDREGDRAAKLADYAAAGVSGCDGIADALRDAELVLSLVTADQALAVARSAAEALARGAVYCDMNSVAPQTKRAAAAIIEAAGGRYVDAAVMAPVQPGRLSTPLLLSGPWAEEAMARLASFGFSNMRVVGNAVGRASSIKMLRSVIVKGTEALAVECLLAAEAAGVRGEVLDSLDLGEMTRSWAERADHSLDRMMIHGLRRAAEMDEVVKTLDALGTGSAMSRATAERQRAIGALGIACPGEGLAAKLAQIDGKRAAA
jgi:3-hydroxyisobutyrate dehydrogenase-like beta-hydroxyacid dehydrogenase